MATNLAQVINPFPTNYDSGNLANCNDRDDVAFALAGLGQAAPGPSYSFAGGIFPGASANGSITDLALQPSSPASMSPLVNFGNCQIPRAAHGIVLGALTSTVPATISSNPSSYPRADYVVARARDIGLDGPSYGRTADVIVLTGTPTSAGSEAGAAGQLSDGDFIIACVTVPSGASAITAGMISDRRVYAAAQGGIYPASAVDTRAGSFPGQMRFNLQSYFYEAWDPGSSDGSRAAAWQPVANILGWQSYSPYLYYGGDGNVGGTSQCALGTNPTYLGRYQQIGKRLDLNAVVTWGTGPYNDGVGPINAYLPSGFKARNSGGVQQFFAYLYTTSQGYMSWIGAAGVRPGSNVITFAFPTSGADCRVNYYKAASSAGVAGGGCPYIANGFPEGGSLAWSMTLEIA